MAQVKPKVFVSHSHVDEVFAGQFVADLRNAGIDAWLDKTHLGVGDYMERINEALIQCEWFLLVLTRAAVDSKWVRQEVNAANGMRNQGRIRDLIFVQAGTLNLSEVPALWGVYSIIDATMDYGSALSRVVDALVQGPPPPLSPPRDASGSAYTSRPIFGQPLSATGKQPKVVSIAAGTTLFGRTQGVVCPSCNTFNPLGEVEIARTRLTLFGGSFPIRCAHCRSVFHFTAEVGPDANT